MRRETDSLGATTSLRFRVERRWRSADLPVRALLVIVLAALSLRLFNLNWDDGRRLHPDELFIVHDALVTRISIDWPPDLGNLLDPDRSGLNPRSLNPDTGAPREYPYGALPLLVTDTVATLLGGLTGHPWSAGDQVYLVGRALSALLDSLTVVVVFAIARDIFSARLGVIAALFAAIAPISIQLAHFFTPDSWLTFFVSLTLYGAIRAAGVGATRRFIVTGAAFGLAMATKGSVFALAGLIVAAVIYDVWRRSRLGNAITDSFAMAPRQLGAAAVAAIVCFGLFEPYVFVRPAIYLQSLRTQADIASGAYDVPFTRVYVGTLPVIYQIEQFVRWGVGPVSGGLALGGIWLLARRFWRTPSGGAWILLCWLLGYGLVIGLSETKVLRYLAPLMPALAITAALAADTLHAAVRRRLGARLAATALAVLLAGASLWTVAFIGIYAGEHPRLAASRWIYANIPAGSRLSHDLWDDALPAPVGTGLTPDDFQYQYLTFDHYRDAAPAEYANDLFHSLEELDYLILSSNRISAAVVRSPWRYPVQIRFFQLLRSGELGFVRVAEFHVMPPLGPLRIDDRDADESFINYDHPRVEIYQRRQLIDRARYDQLIAPAVAQPWSPTRHRPTD